MDENIFELVKLYFSLGLRHQEILQCISTNHHIIISLRTLRRYLARAGLFRRKYSDICEVALYVCELLNTYGQMHGYRLIHLKCIQAGFSVTKEKVRLLLRILDKEGVELRRRQRLRRRMYLNYGPNYMWHIDGYDKLKPYGIAIHGCIDGFSRYIIWLKAYTTNNNPHVISSYYLQAVREYGGCPARIRADLGTENAHVKSMQQALRLDHQDAYSHRSYIEGSSNHNQRIESWWAFLRSHHAQYWMNLFQGLKDLTLFNGNYIDRSLIQFVFMKIIQEELDDVAQLWNSHQIRPSRNQVAPHGRPMMMFSLPHFYQAANYLCPVLNSNIEVCEQESLPLSPYPCEEMFFDLCCLLMEENNWEIPKAADDGLELYRNLRAVIYAEL